MKFFLNHLQFYRKNKLLNTLKFWDKIFIRVGAIKRIIQISSEKMPNFICRPIILSHSNFKMGVPNNQGNLQKYKEICLKPAPGT